MKLVSLVGETLGGERDGGGELVDAVAVERTCECDRHFPPSLSLSLSCRKEGKPTPPPIVTRAACGAQPVHLWINNWYIGRGYAWSR